MERKSIGSFIAALRRASGMTQRELAEKLNVSDKSVSRWERDEGAPDLSLIPVIAEIFGVTSDELLRGERAAGKAPEERSPERSRKQRARLLAVGLSKYRTRSLISAALALVGLIAALVCNLAFYKAYVGFFVGALFFLAAAVCQGVCLNSAMLTVADEELDGSEVSDFKRRTIALGEKVWALTLLLFAGTLPLLLAPSGAGLGGYSWAAWLPLPCLTALALSAVVCYFLNNSLQKRGVYTLPEKAAAVCRRNFVLKRRCTLGLLAMLFVSLLGNALLTGGWDVGTVAEYTEFDNVEDFVAYMGQPIIWENGSYVAAPQQVEPGTYFDEQGNEITEDEANTHTLTDRDGNVLCTYVQRNESVWSVRHGEGENFLPIRVASMEQIQAAQRQINQTNAIFLIAYVLELAAAFAVYFLRRAR